MTATTAAESGLDLDRKLTAAMASAQAGDRQAYERLLRDSAPIVRRVARRGGAVGDRIEDVVQDVLITVHRVRHTFDPARSYVAWLTAIAQRRTIDLLRRTGRQQSREINAPLAYEAYADPGHETDTAEAASEADRLRAAIATLPAGQREAVTALALQEYSLNEASATTGKTKTALKVNLHRAIRTLRSRLAGQ
ncbi:MAG: sigma-70 family RNA polymerase sigma factor [Bauldia sp.]